METETLCLYLADRRELIFKKMEKYMFFLKLKKGFSLIELMIVIAIIGILAIIGIPAYQNYLIRARVSEVFNTLNVAKQAITETVITKTISQMVPIWPTTNNGAGLNDPSSNWGPMINSLTVNTSSTTNSAPNILTAVVNTASTGIPNNLTIIFSANYINRSVVWTCSSSGDTQYAPSICR
ncbi:MAG: pilE [Francisellaceae bacterium]|nr:pilE [Francisellaceae bacterium]